MIKTDEILLKKNRYEFSSAFIDQRFPNMVQRLFPDVIHDAIWLMNIHEQKYPWFLAMQTTKEKGQITIYKILYRKLKIEQYDPY